MSDSRPYRHFRMFEKFHHKSNVWRGLTHLIDEHHLSDHERRQHESDSKTTKHNKREPRNGSCCLELNNHSLKKLVGNINYSRESEYRGKVGPNEGQRIDFGRFVLEILSR